MEHRKNQQRRMHQLLVFSKLFCLHVSSHDDDNLFVIDSCVCVCVCVQFFLKADLQFSDFFVLKGKGISTTGQKTKAGKSKLLNCYCWFLRAWLIVLFSSPCHVYGMCQDMYGPPKKHMFMDRSCLFQCGQTK